MSNQSRRRCPVCHNPVRRTPHGNISCHTDKAGNGCEGSQLPFEVAQYARDMRATRRVVPESSMKPLRAANRQRTAYAAPRQVAQAHNAIRAIETGPVRYGHSQHLRALYDRVAHPEATLAEIADHLGITKDTYASRLRRAFEHAERFGVTK